MCRYFSTASNFKSFPFSAPCPSSAAGVASEEAGIRLSFNTPPDASPKWDIIYFDEIPTIIHEIKVLAANQQGWTKMDLWTKNNLTLGKVQLHLIPDPEQNPDVVPSLNAMVKLDFELPVRPAAGMANPLAEHLLIKPFAAQYAGSLANNARIVVVIPAPPAPATVPPVPGECYHILTSTKYSASCTYRTAPYLFRFSQLLFVIPYPS
jgi:hypothetical protein